MACSATRATGTETESSRSRSKLPIASKTSTKLPPFPAWTFSSSAKTISACPWAFTKNTNSHTCTRRPNSTLPPNPSSTPPKRTTSFSVSSSSAPPASANFSTKDSPSSASATIYTTSSRKPAPTSSTSSASPKKTANPGLAGPHRSYKQSLLEVFLLRVIRFLVVDFEYHVNCGFDLDSLAVQENGFIFPGSYRFHRGPCK